jgi:DNA-damage-inducible protein J
MAKSAMIRARVEPKLKRSAEAVLGTLGVTPTEAVTVFYTQVSLQRGLPFDVRIPNKETRRAIREARAGKNLIRYRTLEEFKKDMRSL